MRREYLGHRHHLQAVILTVEQGVLIFASGGNFIAHRFGWHIHAEQDAEIGLFADTVRIELGKVAAPRFARFDLED
jgi:uncharacterized protein (DUF885 family)